MKLVRILLLVSLSLVVTGTTNRFIDTERSNPDADLREIVNRCNEYTDKGEWETTSCKELPRRVRRNLPDDFGPPV